MVVAEAVEVVAAAVAALVVVVLAVANFLPHKVMWMRIIMQI
jgi:hypothetical protein